MQSFIYGIKQSVSERNYAINFYDVKQTGVRSGLMQTFIYDIKQPFFE